MKPANKKQFLSWAFYLVVLYIVYRFMIGVNAPLKHATVFVAMQILAFYVNFLILLPKFFDQKKYWKFGLLNAIILVIGAIGITVSEGGLPSVEGHTILNTYYTIETLMAHSVPLLIGTFTAFVFYTYEKQLQQEEREKERIIAEKDFLVQQINPHFLFNTLNNIYSLSVDNNLKSSEALLQLSEMLDYSLYGNKKEFTSLSTEIQYINNFISLFKLKDEEITNISFTYKLESNVKIAPMLLLPFVENAFKHGNIEDTKKGFIKINVESIDAIINFECINSYTEEKQVYKVGGIGISNVSRRLELIYHQKHNLKITAENGLYSVHLKLNNNGI